MCVWAARCSSTLGGISVYRTLRRCYQHTSAYVSRHPSAYVSIRQHTWAARCSSTLGGISVYRTLRRCYQHTVSIRQHPSAYVGSEVFEHVGRDQRVQNAPTLLLKMSVFVLLYWYSKYTRTKVQIGREQRVKNAPTLLLKMPVFVLLRQYLYFCTSTASTFVRSAAATKNVSICAFASVFVLLYQHSKYFCTLRRCY